MKHSFAFVAMCCIILMQCSCGDPYYEDTKEMKQADNVKSDMISSQPRMYTANGHLYFEATGSNISFVTKNQGNINFDGVNLKPLMSQVEKNRQDIEDIKNSGTGGVSPDLENRVDQNEQNIANVQGQVNAHNKRLDDLESEYQSLKTAVDAIQNDLGNDDCSSSPCKNGGSCIDLYKSYACTCTSQYEGSSCEIDHNECLDFALTGIGCLNGGTCINTDGGFRCDCPPSYYGPLCGSIYDDCTDGNKKCVHGICINSPRDDPNVAKYTCLCESGWTNMTATDPTCTKDVDECVNSPCSSNPPVECINIPGSFMCGSCPSGYEGNGFYCTDINECASNNGGCSIAPSVNCINIPGSHYCGSCPAGYTGDGYVCTPLDPCYENGGCHPIASCNYNAALGTVACTCPPGYIGSGVGPFGCMLQQSNCTSQTCINGQCVTLNGLLTCICDPGWSGDNCDYNTNECESSPCLNGGICGDGVNGYSCTCPDGYAGTNCQLQTSGCGGNYKAASGSIQYPSPLGQQYPADSNCLWIVTVELGKAASITFSQFDVEQSHDCANDFLQVNDGGDLSAQLIGKYCGQTLPEDGDMILSTHNVVHFWFASNQAVSGDGFEFVWTSVTPICGEEIVNLDHGIISSPGYPGKYPQNRDCYWTIIVEPGNVVQLLFGTISLESTSKCNKDFLEIRDGILEDDPILARYCGDRSPPPLLTTAPGALLRFRTDGGNEGNGFQINWAKQPIDINGCGGYLTEDNGVIISPQFPNAYDNDQQCVWVIHIQDNGQITLTFTDMDIPGDDTCSNDYLEVYDGPLENSPLAGKYCGTNVPTPYTSSGQDLYLKFKSDSAATGQGFRLTYAVACGGVYTDESGTLLSPYYPSMYPNDKECEYMIRQPPGYVITLMIEDIDIQNDPSCTSDYLEIHDGSIEESPILGIICGNVPAPPMMSTQNYMFIHFSSDSAINGRGFKATYTTQNTGCGGVYTDNTGSISSPGHPSPYPRGANCTYYVWVDPSYVISLQFLSFVLESPTNGVCTKDYVEIFDGPNMMAPSLGRFCGSTLPPTIASKSFELTLFFTTDNDTDSQGFAAAYTTLNASTACGGRITGQDGYIKSPNYPENYPPMRTCIWTLVFPTSMQIEVDFTEFQFEAGNAEGTCSFDYLELRNGGYEDSPLIGEYCGDDSPGTFITHSNELYIKMVTDQYQESRGFLMNYGGGRTGCGGTITSADGGFQSPNYPFPYPHATECNWLIKVSEGSAVRLVFINFDVETHGFCEFDYVEAYDGPTTGYPSFGKICGTRIPEPFESSDNTLLVKFSSDANSAGSGFIAQYHTICERTIMGKTSGLIQSLDFPEDYPPNRDCKWTIQGSYGNPLNATFKTFSLETCDDCICDYVEIIDGGDSEDSESLGKFCGTQLPPRIRTKSHIMQVKFHTDPYLPATGFELAWAVDGCGDTFTEPSGSFSSPNYPSYYDPNRECIWQIITDPGTSIQLTIDAFDVEYHPDCEAGVLEVYNGLQITDDFRLAQLCNSNRPPDLPMHVPSTSSFMTVRFLTDDKSSGRGFHASYEQQKGGCGGYYTTKTGSFHSLNYPNTYPSNTDCEWFIDAGIGSTVILKFDVFDLEEEEKCEYDYVAVYDGHNPSNVTLLLKACGRTLPSPVISYDNLMLVQFHSDPYTAHSGFLANFASTGCGGRLTASPLQSEVISSINYPLNYPPEVNCTWIISSPSADGHVTITFTHLDLYKKPTYNGPCGEYDYIIIRDGASTSSSEFGRYCGSVLPASFTSYSNSFTITFVSQSEYQASGFRFIYAGSTSECGGDLTGPMGYFNSPNYPDEYPPDTQCNWIIRSAPGNRIQVSFLSFDLEDHEDCNFDYVIIREGSAYGPVLAKICGKQIPSNITSVTGHILHIQFVSDVGTVGKGFSAYFQHIYGSTTIGKLDGSIGSPMYPGNYPPLLDVFYYVYVPGGRFINYGFGFLDLQAMTEAGCVNDVVIIYDGDTISSPVLSYVCGNQYLPEGYTTQDAMLVRFQSDAEITGGGFLLYWVAVEGEGIPPNPTNVPTIQPGICGSPHMIAPLSPSRFYSPGWPDNYPTDQDCRWTIEAASGYRVMLTIISLDMEGAGTGDNCDFDYISVHDGPTISSNRLGKYCGRIPPPDPIFSSGQFMSVRFESDSTLGHGGFIAEYQQGCGGVINSNQGVVTSPNYPGDYPINTDCVWVITVSLGYTISIDFNNDYEIVNSDTGCSQGSGDYVQLLNGFESDSPPLPGVDGTGQYCGSTPPSGLETSSHYLYVKFRSDSKDTGKGFSLTFNAKGTGCGGSYVLTDQYTLGTISSPGYATSYPHGADCIWIINAPAGEAIQVDFTDFQLEGGTGCPYDYVLLVDGETANDPILGRYCGSTQPPTTKSTGNTMLVRFRTDADTGTGGFKATYKIARCGGTLVGISGEIASPEYPGRYPNSVSCDWEIRAPAYHFVLFQFTALELYESSDCGNGNGDYIEFRMANKTAEPYATVCGSDIPSDVDTEDNIAYIHFESDGSDNARGFRLEFTASEDVCGGELIGTAGSLTTPNYPNAYDHARVCTWLITVAADRAVTLEFFDFDVEDPHDDYGCVFDYVEVYNGILPNSPRINRYCGPNKPPVLTSTGNTMKVIFRTDASLANAGFFATYTSTESRVCGGTLGDSDGGSFTTPNYPSNYGNNQECLWTITAPRPTNVTTVITFKTFSLENHIECRYDMLMVKAGSDYNGYYIGTFCGRTIPQPIALALQDNFIQFTSDYSATDKGFEAEYAFKPCGGLVTGTASGEITSPNFPEQYNNNDLCLWTIAVEAGQSIKLHWTAFHVEAHSSCVYDYVKIFNGPTTSSPLVDSYCNSNVPTDFTAESNTITILFRSDYSVPHDGFRVEWEVDTSGCGNFVIHKHSGSITSPNYPQNYPANADCIWDIVMDPAYHVSVSFENDFDIEYQDTCKYDYVELLDGLSLSSPTLSHFCGFYGTESAPNDTTIIESSLGTMRFRFRSDFAGSGGGFKADYEAVCGLYLTSESGSFQTPNYPSPYNIAETCYYSIQYPEHSKFIKLTFNQFSLQSGSQTACVYDYVAVATGDTQLGKFCGNFPPNGPISAEGSMMITFYSDYGTIGYGFLANYESANCGGMITDSAGTISAFTHSNLHHNRNCTWIIEVDPVKVVEIEFTSFDVEAHPSCGYDYLKVYDGSSTLSPVIGTYCGSYVPKFLLSSANTLTMEFITDQATNEDGFTADYRESTGPLEGCGGTLTQRSGRFSSIDLNGDGLYDANLNCLWVIEGTLNQVITISFINFTLENATSTGCIYDRVEIHDGQSDLDPIAVTACGIILPAPFTSSTNFLSVRFISDPFIQYAGFMAQYTTQERTCGGTYTATDDFQALQYPPEGTSLNNAKCRWVIDAGTDVSHYIMISFQQVNIKSPADSGTNCNEAYLEVRDYPPGDYIQSYRYCANGLAHVDFHSLGQTVQLNLKTDSDTVGDGFILQYKRTNCTKELTQPHGQIFSPGWPTLYPHNVVCTTTITVPEGNQIQIFFNFFEIEYHVNCTYDYLEIRDGADPTSPLIGRFCGFSLPNPIFPLTNSVFMQLSSDPFVHEKGYDITYTSTEGQCGGIVTGDHGTITSLNFPQAYTPNMLCEFSIRTPAGRPVTIHIPFIDIYYECSNGCRCAGDTLWIYAGPTGGPAVGGYCGYGGLGDIKTGVNSAFIRFKTSNFTVGSRSNTGFRIRFES